MIFMEVNINGGVFQDPVTSKTIPVHILFSYWLFIHTWLKFKLNTHTGTCKKYSVVVIFYYSKMFYIKVEK
jgi:hypothetical protein